MLSSGDANCYILKVKSITKMSKCQDQTRKARVLCGRQLITEMLSPLFLINSFIIGQISLAILSLRIQS